MRTLLGDAEHAPLLRPGALLVVDNTLWKGLVLRAADPAAAAAADGDDGDEALPRPEDFGPAARMARRAADMHAFNAFVQAQPALAPLLLPLRDGLSLVRYAPPL